MVLFFEHYSQVIFHSEPANCDYFFYFAFALAFWALAPFGRNFRHNVMMSQRCPFLSVRLWRRHDKLTCLILIMCWDFSFIYKECSGSRFSNSGFYHLNNIRVTARWSMQQQSQIFDFRFGQLGGLLVGPSRPVSNHHRLPLFPAGKEKDSSEQSGNSSELSTF